MKEKSIKFLIPLGIAICWLVIYGITLFIGNTVPFDVNTVATVAVAVVTFFFPYENISHLLTLDFLFEEYNEKTSSRTMRRIVIWGALILLTFFTGLLCEVRQCLIIINLVVIYLFAYISDVVERTLPLCLIAQFLLIVNSFLCTFYKKDFLSLAIYMFAIMFTFYLFLVRSRRRYKIPAIIGFSLLNFIELGMALYVLGKFSYIQRFFEYGEVYPFYDGESFHFLSLAFSGDVEKLDYSFLPFSAVYYKLGLPALILFFLAFIGILVLVIKSKKYISFRRYMILTFIFSMFAATYVHVLLANLSLMPTSVFILIARPGQLIYISIVFRLFYSRKKPETREVKKVSEQI